jgi:hypothetical protein
MSAGSTTAQVCRVLFVCDASIAMGFGHASRCLELGLLVRDRLARDGAIPVFAFQGIFSEGARARLLAAVPDLQMHPPDTNLRADVAVIDRMTDTEDLDVWSPALVDELSARCARVIYLASGRTAPPLPARVDCIGYQPGGPVPRPPSLRWGLEFAPVALGNAPGRITREGDRALVALGGSPDATALKVVLEVLATCPQISTIDVLLSPVSDDPPEGASQPGQTVSYHRNVPAVLPLLTRAGLVIASYGHLAWEALAVGAPVCLVGQKRFQAELAESLADAGLAVSAGLMDAGARTRLAQAIPLTLSRAAELGARARAVVDGQGLHRIADIICEGIEGGR